MRNVSILGLRNARSSEPSSKTISRLPKRPICRSFKHWEMCCAHLLLSLTLSNIVFLSASSRSTGHTWPAYRAKISAASSESRSHTALELLCYINVAQNWFVLGSCGISQAVVRYLLTPSYHNGGREIVRCHDHGRGALPLILPRHPFPTTKRQVLSRHHPGG